MAVIDLVKWDAPDDVLAWKFPSQELSTWTQLIVAESQEAMLVAGGQMEGPFGPGRHTLSTANLPLLRSIMGLPFGGRSPFTAEVWFVNRSIPLDITWELNRPMQLEDPKYRVMLPVIASGQYGATVEHTKRFLTQFVGTMPKFDRARLQEYLRGVIVTRVKDLIAKSVVTRGISILEISAFLNELSDALRHQIEGELAGYGLRVASFFVDTISTPESDMAVQKMKAALAERAARSIQGFTYQEERSFDALQTAAGNEGTAGSLLGAGMGIGMGAGIGAPIGAAMGVAAQQMVVSPPKQAAPSSPAGAAPPAVDNQASANRVALLREVAQLHSEGVLTDEEFVAEKRRILGS